MCLWGRAGVQRDRNWMRGAPISPDRIMGMTLQDIKNRSALSAAADSDDEFDPKAGLPSDGSTSYSGSNDRCWVMHSPRHMGACTE